MNDERQARIDQIKARVDAATPGPWIQGMWSGVCERLDHTTPHPGPPECTYTQYLRTYPEAMAYVSVAPNVTLIGGNEYGPWLTANDAALIANTPTDLAWLLAELASAQDGECNICEMEAYGLMVQAEQDNERLTAELAAAQARAERAEAERDRTQQWLDRFQSEAATQQVRAIRAEQRLKKIAAAGYDLEGQAMTFVLSFHVRERHPGEYDDALCGNGTCNSVRKHVAAWKAALRAALAEGA